MSIKPLTDYTVEDFYFDSKVHELNDTATLYDAIMLISDNHISAVPIYSEGEGRYLGWVDILDILQFISKLVESGNEHIMSIQSGTKSVSVLKCINLSGRQVYTPVKEGTSVLDVLASMKKGASRVPVIGTTGKIVKIISQSSVIKWLAEHSEEMNKSLTEKSLKEVNLGFKTVVGIAIAESTIEAVKIMGRNKLSAIAIFQEDGQLLSNVSGSDICAAVATGFELSIPVQTFIGHMRTKFVMSKRKGRDFPAAVTAHGESTLKTVIQRLGATGLHRLYVTDLKTNFPVGVVALQDIISILI